MIKKMDQKEAITKLKELLKPKDTVYCILTKLSNSGCYRHINFYKFYSTKKLDKIGRNVINKYWLSFLISIALKLPLKEKTHSVGIGGGGMDMGFHIVYELSHLLFKDGYKLTHEWL
tara:strand:+ start:145 stop:495 length:351 start_codon:yes stop_codon:yes gene_type:complete